MRRRMQGTLPIVLILALALSGCSDSSAPQSVTVGFKSPAVVKATLPALYTCDGKNISPPLEWGAVPSTTRELALFILGLTPNRATGRYTTSVEWAIAGVNPALHRMSAGEVPPGAHLAVTNSNKRTHYSICPKRGSTERYQFALYAVPATLTVPVPFVGIKLLALVANPESENRSNAGGAFVASYTRPAHAAGPHGRARG